MRWQIHNDCTNSSPNDIINAILQNRGLITQTDINTFLHPVSPLKYTPSQVGIDTHQLKNTLKLLESCITNQTPIVIYGDYDADGITATAILWETLHSLGAKAIPFIPSREQHGYGLSIKGLEDALKLAGHNPLIITVDNGIVAKEAADWLKQKNIPLIITDHHSQTKTLPHAKAIVHSTEISGAGVAWFLSKELSADCAATTLDLVAIGTIADMMPLIGINRSFAKFGLQALSKTHRPGLKALLSQADLQPDQELSTYHVNYVIAPRLNAMGRLEHAIDSLRLICTTNPSRAESLAQKLGSTNRTRQDLTVDLLAQAISQIDAKTLASIIIVEDENFHEGIIGLIAGKLVETYSRPAIVISKKADISKASARSIKGINITELIRSQSSLLLGVGGHPMAAGFSIETNKIDTFKQAITEHVLSHVDPGAFDPILEIDCTINESDISEELYDALTALQPFGIGNKEPVFALKAEIMTVQSIGKNQNHKKLMMKRKEAPSLQAIWFNPPESSAQIQPGNKVNLAGTIGMNTWRNKSSLQIILKDVQV